MIDKTISHYKILAEIGRGGMGEVYLAEDLKLKRKVALKFLHPDVTRDEEFKKRFIHEAQTASTLEHNNICNIHEIGETEDGQLFISMAYYKGETLKSKIEELPLKIDDLIEIAIQITQGLARTHQSNIIHRDLKPANIIITDRDEVKIVDFGLAKLAGQTKLTQEGTTLGTVAYMSPEQSHGEAVDQKTDIWSLGVMLYEIISGQLPFKGDYEQAILFSIMNDEPEQEYFCDGITEQIITNLTKLKQLKVIARTSVMKFKQTQKTVPEIGRELNVAHVLEGSVRKSGSRIRVTAQLIKSDDGYHLWAEDYDRELVDIFTVQDDVSKSISEALLGQLNQASFELIKTDKPVDIELYDKYLLAKDLNYKFLHFQKAEYLTNAIMILTEILEKEPDYLSANTLLADIYNSYYNMVVETAAEKKRFLQLQEKYIGKAYQLNPRSSQVLFVKTFVSLARFETDHPEGKEEFEFNRWKELVKLYPHHHGANLRMGLFLFGHGLVYHSLPYYNKAVEVDPLEPWNYSGRGHSYYLIGEFDKAAQNFEKGLEIEPNNYWNMIKYMYLLIMLRKEEEAKKLLDTFENIYPEKIEVINYGKSLLMALKQDSTRAFMFFERSGFGQSSKLYLYLLLDKKDDVIKLMQDRQEKEGKNITRSRYLSYKNLLWYDNLREDERFQKILEIEKERYQIILEKYEIKN
jgi:serine/threonine protein kinase